MTKKQFNFATVMTLAIATVPPILTALHVNGYFAAKSDGERAQLLSTANGTSLTETFNVLKSNRGFVVKHGGNIGYRIGEYKALKLND